MVPSNAGQVTYLLYSETSDATVASRLGWSEYSYFFVREAFRRMIAPRAEAVVVTDPAQADFIHDAYAREGKACVLLSFAPPHRSVLNLRCPTVPIFAWEFDTIPTEVWDGDRRNDWRVAFEYFGNAVTLSDYARQSVASAMPSSFPVEVIPAPVWDRCRHAAETFRDTGVCRLIVETASDTRRSPPRLLEAPLRAGAKSRRAGLANKWRRSLHKRLPRWWRRKTISQKTTIELGAREVVYTTVFNPGDDRKNWRDMVTAFCLALANCDDATLVIKLVVNDGLRAIQDIEELLGQLPPFRCRVVTIADFMDTDAYRRLIHASTFVVNTSLCEGQCLPLSEFMSWGKPALAPNHTAMADYIDDSVAFVIESSLDPCVWPHDPRRAIRANRYRLNWPSVARAFADSYATAKRDPERLATMSRNAVARQQALCSEDVAFERLEQVACQVAAGGRRSFGHPNQAGQIKQSVERA